MIEILQSFLRMRRRLQLPSRIKNFSTTCCICILLGAAYPKQQPNSVAPGIRQELDSMVSMRDGLKLATDVFRPEAPGQFPVLLIRTPYNKGADPSKGEYRYWAERGYAVVVQDVRGRNGSEGEWNPFFREADDGYDAQRWAAAQPWSNGEVISYGASYLSLVQWLAATKGNPSLRGMVSNVVPHDFYEGLAYVGGAFQPGTGITWSAIMDGRAKPLPLLDMTGWFKAFRHLPVTDAVESIGRDPKFFREWISHPTYDDYWRRLRWQESYGKFDFPVLNIGGWYDIFQKGAAENFRKMRLLGPPGRKSAHRLVIGPWPHSAAGSLIGGRNQGTVDFGPTSEIDLRRLVTRWLDHYARRTDNGADRDAPVKIFTMGENAWHDYQDWPVEGTKYLRYYLRSKGGANSAGGDGELRTLPPGEGERADAFTYDPDDPVPTVGGGNCCLPQVLPWGPMDQQEVERRRDVLVYTTPPLSDGVRVTGPVVAKLWVRSSARDTDFTVKLVDVRPDGFAMNLTDGILRARYRNSFEKPSLLKPGQAYLLMIDTGITSNRFMPGHRIRVEIASSNFPRFSRNTNTGNQPETDTSWKVARQEVLHDARHPSYIILPVLP